MKQFTCQSCGSTVFFRNSSCVSCGAKLGYSPDEGTMFALHQADAATGDGALWRAAGDAPSQFHFCANADHGVCNWLIPARENQSMCRSCRHNHLAPDLTIEGNLARWQRVEQAKQHLFYSLIRWGLPIPTQADGAAEPLETAHALGLSIHARGVDDPGLKTDVAFDAYRARDFGEIVAAWTPVSVALNSLTRSLGQQDAWPFVLSRTIVAKLDFIHRLIRAQEAETAAARA